LGSEINQVATPPFPVVKPDIEPRIDLKGRGPFFPERGEVPVVRPMYFLRIVAQEGEVVH